MLKATDLVSVIDDSVQICVRCVIGLDLCLYSMMASKDLIDKYH